MRTATRGVTLFGVGLAMSNSAIAGGTLGYLYKVTQANLVELPRLGGDESEARDINDIGQIVGSSLNHDGVSNAFLYHPTGNIQNIGTVVKTEESFASGINNNAEVVGSWMRGGRWRPFYWHASTSFVKMNIEVQPGEDYNDQYYMHAIAINDSGQIVGRAVGDYGTYETDIPVDGCHWDIPVYWSSPNAVPKVLKCSPDWWGANGAWDISNSGWIAHSDWGSRQHGYRRAQASGVSYEIPLPTHGLDDRAAKSVNESGAVAGYARMDASGDYERQAIFWNGTSETSKFLGVLPGGHESLAHKINGQNFVVGFSEKALHVNGSPFVGHRAFIWHADFGMYELPAFANSESGSVSTCVASALDNLIDTGRRGLRIRVVGWCTKPGKKRAVRWDVYLGEHRPQGTL